jgi:type III secretion protein D
MEVTMNVEHGSVSLKETREFSGSDAMSEFPRSFRVLSGLHRGALVEIPSDRWFLLGSADDCDIVLHDGGVSNHHCLIALTSSGFSLRVLAGAVVVDGRLVTMGQAFSFNDFTLCQIEALTFSIGQSKEEAWAELGMKVDCQVDSTYIASQSELSQDLGSDAVGAGFSGVAAEGGISKLSAFTSFLSGNVMGKFRASVVVAGTCVAVVFAWWAISYASTLQADPLTIETLVADLGLKEVSVEQNLNGQLEIKGVIPAESQRVRLVGELAQRGVHPKINIVTGEHLARSAEDAFRQSGLDARARYVGHGKLEILGVAPTANAQEVAAQILQSIKGVKDLAFSESSSRADESSKQLGHSKVVTGGGASKSDSKRVAAIVGGSEPFIVTADGGRYGLGAILGDGSIVEHIEDDVVTFRRGQEAVAFKF